MYSLTEAKNAAQDEMVAGAYNAPKALVLPFEV
jgi:hypothetical protein